MQCRFLLDNILLCSGNIWDKSRKFSNILGHQFFGGAAGLQPPNFRPNFINLGQHQTHLVSIDRATVKIMRKKNEI